MLLRSTLQHWYRNATCSKISLSSTNLNPSTPRSQRKFFILSVIQFLWCYFEEFGVGSTNNYPNDIYLYSYHLSSCHCIFFLEQMSWSLLGFKGLRPMWHYLQLSNGSFPFLYQFHRDLFFCLYLESTASSKRYLPKRD